MGPKHRPGCLQDVGSKSGSYFCQLQSICCFTGPRAGQASGTHQMCGAHSQGGAGSDRSPCPRWHLHGSCPGCRISLARCVHRPDGVGWDGFPPLCSSLQPGAVDLGSQEQPELRVLFPLPLSVSPSPFRFIFIFILCLSQVALCLMLLFLTLLPELQKFKPH